MENNIYDTISFIYFLSLIHWYNTVFIFEYFKNDLCNVVCNLTKVIGGIFRSIGPKRTATTSADRLYSNIILYRIKVIMVKVIIKIGWSWPFTSITVPELSHLLGVGHFGSGRHQLPTFVVAEYVR